MEDGVGKQILVGLAETRRFFHHISQLLLEADNILGEASWSCSSTNKATDLTGHISQPQKWMPRNIYRFYQSATLETTPLEFPMNTLFVGVLLDREGLIGFEEPWLTFGMYQLLDNRRYRYEDWIQPLASDQVEPNGVFHSETSTYAPEADDLIPYYSYAAVPLISIQGVEELRRHVIDPLLHELESFLKKIRQNRLP